MDSENPIVLKADLQCEVRELSLAGFSCYMRL